MYNDMFSLIMAAEESILKAELGISEFDDNTRDEITAMESVAICGNVSGGMALESIFTDQDDYGWGSAMEGDTESSEDAKPNIFKRIGAAIKAAFKKLGDLFSSIGERIKKWWKDHFDKRTKEINKQIETAKAQTQATPATRNWKNIPHPSDPAGTASGQAVKNASSRYFEALLTAIDGGVKPANAASNLVDELKAKFIGGKPYTENDKAHTEEQLRNLAELIKKAEENIKNAKDAKVEFTNAITPFKVAGEDFKKYCGSVNPSALKGNLDKITNTCDTHAKFCRKFAEEYERISGNAKTLSPKSAAVYGEKVDFGKEDGVHEIRAQRALDRDLYAVAKEYLNAGTVLNTLTSEYTMACSLYAG